MTRRMKKICTLWDIVDDSKELETGSNYSGRTGTLMNRMPYVFGSTILCDIFEAINHFGLNPELPGDFPDTSDAGTSSDGADKDATDGDDDEQSDLHKAPRKMNSYLKYYLEE